MMVVLKFMRDTMRFLFIAFQTGEVMLDIREEDYVEAMKAFADEFGIDPEGLLLKKELHLFQVYD